ncbi:MAG: helix-turn-helix domain-containing protein [Anaerovoracaceae bacterium]
MERSEWVKEIRKTTGMNRKDFAEHLGIPLRTVEDWEAGRRTPPEYIPRLIEYTLKYEELIDNRK